VHYKCQTDALRDLVYLTIINRKRGLYYLQIFQLSTSFINIDEIVRIFSLKADGALSYGGAAEAIPYYSCHVVGIMRQFSNNEQVD